MNSQDDKILRHTSLETVVQGYEKDQDFLHDLKNLAKVSRSKHFPISKISDISEDKCQTIVHNAEHHRDANIFNGFHFELFRARDEKAIEQCRLERIENQCICGCMQVKGKDIPWCFSGTKLHFIGSTSNLFLLFIKTVIVLAAILLLFYTTLMLISHFAFPMGIEAPCLKSEITCIINWNLSIESRQRKPQMIVIEMWSSLLLIIIMCVILRIAKYKAQMLDNYIDKSMLTPSDMAVRIENLPPGISQIEILQFLKKKEIQMEIGYRQDRKPLAFKSIHLVYNLRVIRQKILAIEKKSIELSSMVDRKGKLRQQSRVYLKEKTKLIELIEELEDLRKKFHAEQHYRRMISACSCIIEFKDEESQEKFMRNYGGKKYGVLDQLRLWWEIKVMKRQAKQIHLKGNLLRIEEAPEPEDIIWQNCEKNYSLGRALVIWAITFIIILISFACLLGLDYLQVRMTDENFRRTISTANIFDYLIAFFLMMVNNILWASLAYLVIIQYSHTKSQVIISQVNKSIVAQFINCIVVPAVVNLIFQHKMFGNDGLISGIVNYAITNSLVQVVLVYIDIKYLVKQFIMKFRVVRYSSNNFVILVVRFLARSEIVEDNQKYVASVNQFLEGSDINITSSYVYLSVGLLHCVTNCTLQPLIIVIFTGGAILFYNVKKYLLFRRYKIPYMLNKRVFDNALMALVYVPIFHTLGQFIFNFYLFKFRWDMTIPCAIQLLLGLIHLRNPNGIFDKITNKIYVAVSPSKYRKAIQKRETKRVTRLLQVARHSSKGHSKKLLELSQKKEINEIDLSQMELFGNTLHYYHHNHLRTLLGYKIILRGQTVGEKQVVSKEIKRYVEECVDDGTCQFEYPRDVESDTNSELVSEKKAEMI